MRILGIFFVALGVLPFVTYATSVTQSELIDDSSHIAATAEVKRLSDDEIAKMEYRLSQLTSQLSSEKEQLQNVRDNLKDAQYGLDAARKSVLVVGGQLQNLDAEKELLTERLAYLERQQEIHSLTISLLESRIYHQSHALGSLAEGLGDLVRLLYEETRWGAFEQLFAANTLAEQINHEEYLILMEDKVGDMYDELLSARQELHRDRLALRKEQQEMRITSDDLAHTLEKIAIQQEAKEELLASLHLTEREYQQRLDEARQRYIAIDSQLRHLVTEEVVEVTPKVKGYIWPSSVADGILEGFMDSQFASIYGVENYGINIKLDHGSKVRSIGDGVVLKVHNGGRSYSYLVVAHGNGLSSLYGHMSGFNVVVGDTVSQGDVIGWSGGTPGSKGAGWMSSGPHLHFEIRKDGVPVDPIDYLP